VLGETFFWNLQVFFVILFEMEIRNTFILATPGVEELCSTISKARAYFSPKNWVRVGDTGGPLSLIYNTI
jgi:hypothetical protein